MAPYDGVIHTIRIKKEFDHSLDHVFNINFFANKNCQKTWQQISLDINKDYNNIYNNNYTKQPSLNINQSFTKSVSDNSIANFSCLSSSSTSSDSYLCNSKFTSKRTFNSIESRDAFETITKYKMDSM